jgi:hypothetical protein
MCESFSGQAGTRIDVTKAMIEAGVQAYLAQASHDEMSFRTPQELVSEVLQAALTQTP